MTRDKIARNMEVIGADGVHVVTVDGVVNGRIKLAKRDSGEGRHKGHAHFINLGLVANVEGQRVRLPANATAAVTFEEEQSGKPGGTKGATAEKAVPSSVPLWMVLIVRSTHIRGHHAPHLKSFGLRCCRQTRSTREVP